VERIRQAGLTKYLQNETREAMCLVELLERMPANKSMGGTPQGWEPRGHLKNRNLWPWP